MNDVIVIENRVDQHCMRHLHLMSNVEPGADMLRRYAATNAVVTREGGAWHLRASHPYRGVIDIPAACADGKFRRLVAWNLTGCLSVKVALHEAWTEYVRLFRGVPQFAYIRRLPKGVDNAVEVGGMMLFEAQWMLGRSVAVGGWAPTQIVTMTIDNAVNMVHDVVKQE